LLLIVVPCYYVRGIHLCLYYSYIRTPFHIHWKVSKPETITRLKTAIKVKIVLNNSRVKIKVRFVDKSSPLRVLAQDQIRNVKWYLEIRKRTIKIFSVMPNAGSLSSSDLIA
jgi:hypothetical protein